MVGMTREMRESEIITQVKEHGGFSIFWVTDNQPRACAADRLIESGRIIRLGGQYPWCAYEIQDN